MAAFLLMICRLNKIQKEVFLRFILSRMGGSADIVENLKTDFIRYDYIKVDNNKLSICNRPPDNNPFTLVTFKELIKFLTVYRL